MVNLQNLSRFTVEAGGIVALADLTTIAERTALIGSASWLDILVLAPGIHLQQRSPELANVGGELPPVGALTSGYVFRVENQAMVGWLQAVGRSGCLVEVWVEGRSQKVRSVEDGAERLPRKKHSLLDAVTPATVIFLLAPILTIAVVVLLIYYKEWWTLGIIGGLILARAINVCIIRRRSRTGWKGASEARIDGDLLVLLSQDRWIRMKGSVDDLKAVTSGQWLQDMTNYESFAAAGATLLVYVTAALSANATTFGNLLLMGLLFVEVGLLGLSNKLVRELNLHERVVRVIGAPKPYQRRLQMAEELIIESKRSDWAIGLGLIKKDGPTDVPGEITL